MTATEASPLVASADASSKPAHARRRFNHGGRLRRVVRQSLCRPRARFYGGSSRRSQAIRSSSARCQARARAFTRSARCSQCYSYTSSAASCRSSHRQPPASPRRLIHHRHRRGLLPLVAALPARQLVRATPSPAFFIFPSLRLTLPRSPPPSLQMGLALYDAHPCRLGGRLPSRASDLHWCRMGGYQSNQLVNIHGHLPSVRHNGGTHSMSPPGQCRMWHCGRPPIAEQPDTAGLSYGL